MKLTKWFVLKKSKTAKVNPTLPTLNSDSVASNKDLHKRRENI